MTDFRFRQPELSGWLRELAADDADSEASAAVQLRLLDEVARLRRARRRSLTKMSVATAALSLATAIPVWRLAMWSGRERSSVAHVRPVQAAREMATAFFPLTYSTVPMSGGRLVRLEVPRATLRAYGLYRESDAASRSVLADVLVGDDGLARAVRFVRPLTHEVHKERRQ